MAQVAQTAANVRAGAAAVTAVELAGEAFSAGQPVYLSSADGKYYKCDADDSAKIAIKGLALTGSDGDGSTFVIQTANECNIGGTTAAGQIYIVGANGGIYPATDLASTWYPVILGTASDNSGTISLICKNGSAALA